MGEVIRSGRFPRRRTRSDSAKWRARFARRGPSAVLADRLPGGHDGVIRAMRRGEG